MRITLSQALIILGWLLFAIALACPGFETGKGPLPGWTCLVVTCWVYPMWLIWPVAVGGIANYSLFYGVLIYFRGGRSARRAYAAFQFLAGVGPVVVVVKMGDGAYSGAYLWLAALFVIPLGFLIGGPREPRPQSPT